MTYPRPDWPRVLRVGLGEGGISVVNQPQSGLLQLYQGRSALRASIEISNYPDAFHSFQKLNLNCVGFEFYKFEAELSGLRPPDWRALDSSSEWYARQCFDAFSTAAKAALDDDQIATWDACSRISSQIRLCELRLRALWDVYAKISQLYLSPSASDYRSVHANGWTERASLEIHSLLQDLCTARDYMCEFASRYILHMEGNEIARTASALIKTTKDRSDIGGNLKALIDELKSKSSFGLGELGLYRDLVTHSAPMSHASDLFGLRLRKLKLGNENIPLIYVPLPNNVESIIQNRSKGALPKNKAEWLKEINNVGEFDFSRDFDSINYLKNQCAKISTLCIGLLEDSKLPQKDTVITDADLAGPIEISTERSI